MDNKEYLKRFSNEKLAQLYYELEIAMIDGLSCDGVSTTAGKSEIAAVIEALSDNSTPVEPGQQEQQAKRAVWNEMQRRVACGEGDSYIQEATDKLSGESSEEQGDGDLAETAERSTVDPGEWQSFHDGFRALVEEELKFAPHNAGHRWLRAYVSYNDKAAECGRWLLSDGLDEGFQARFDLEATRAGAALGSTQDTKPRDFWLHHVFTDLFKHKSKLLFAANKEGGIIRRVCEASAVYCCRLEKKAVEKSAIVSKGRGSLRKAAHRARLTNRLKNEVTMAALGLRSTPEQRELVDAIQELLPPTPREVPASRKHGLPPVIPTMMPPKEEPLFTHSDSYQKIGFRGKAYNLTHHRRAAEIVRVLHVAHKEGIYRVSTEEIRRGIGLKAGGNMYDWFRGTGLWKYLVIEIGKGLYRLDIPLPVPEN